MCYGTAELFREKYPEGKILILDTESNAEASRLENVFNLHPCNGELETLESDPNCFLYFESRIEHAFKKVIEFTRDSAENNIPTLIIIDSVSNVITVKASEALDDSIKKDSEINTYADGMAGNALAFSKVFGLLLAELPKSMTTIMGISQVAVDLKTYGTPERAKSSNALKHAVAISMKFSLINASLRAQPTDDDVKKTLAMVADEVTADDKNMKKTTLTSVNIIKNKLAHCEEGIVLMINNLKGGKINNYYELVNSLARGKGILVHHHAGNYKLRDDLLEQYKGTIIEYNEVEKDSGKVLGVKSKDMSVGWLLIEILNSKQYLDILREEIKNYYIGYSGGVANMYAHMEKYRAKLESLQ
jgi:hypothetical protein